MRWWMDCDEAMSEIYGDWGEDAPAEGPWTRPMTRARARLHLAFCARCAAEARRLALARGMGGVFLPPAPDLAAAVMGRLPDRSPAGAGAGAGAGADGRAEAEPGGFSFRGWVLTGCFLFLSLSTVFLGLDFNHVARAQGSSFLLPVGITVGGVLSCYGAVFISSHLKSLAERFGIGGADGERPAHT